MALGRLAMSHAAMHPHRVCPAHSGLPLSQDIFPTKASAPAYHSTSVKAVGSKELLGKIGLIWKQSVAAGAGEIAFSLAANHNNFSIEWDDLPFAARPSRILNIPVPAISLRTREMEIESVHRVGSHSFFIVRTISDEQLAEGPELSVVHDFYQAWRVRHGLDHPSSVAQDAHIRSPSSPP
jgi:hypothetical protein